MIKPFLKSQLSPISRYVTRDLARIIMFHRFGPSKLNRRTNYDRFEKQLRYITKYYKVKPLSEIIYKIKNGDKLEPYTLALTVDDGYDDFYKYAYPLLNKYQLPATVFLVTDYIFDGIWLWFDAIHYLVHSANSGTYDYVLDKNNITLELGNELGREKAWSDLGDICLSLNNDKRNNVIQTLELTLNNTLPDTPAIEYSPMSHEQIKSMDANLIEYGSHTRTHPILSHCSDTELKNEIISSKNILEDLLERPILSFCYPNGQPNDFNQKSIDFIQSSGYASAVVAYGRLINKNTDLYRLERFSLSNKGNEYKNELNGVPDFKDIALRKLTGLYHDYLM